MKTRPRFKKSNLLSQKQREELLVESTEKANLMATICVLADCFGFGKKRIEKFVDNYNLFMRSVKDGNEDIQEISKTIEERFEIKIL